MYATEPGWVSLLMPWSTAMSVFALTIVNLLVAKWSKERGDKAAVAVDEVKNTLIANGDKTGKKLDDIHKLVNSEYAIALRVGASALERIANSTKEPGDIETARVARNLSKDHDAKQNALDVSKKKENK